MPEGLSETSNMEEYVSIFLLKVNAAGVMPIIFAQAIMMLPIIIAGYATNSASGFVVAFSNMYGFWYNLVTAILIIAVHIFLYSHYN